MIKILAYLLVFFIGAILNGCANEPSTTSKPKAVTTPVVVICNLKSIESLHLAHNYQKARNLNDNQIIEIDCDDNEEISQSDYDSKVLEPVRTHLMKNELRDQINYIVLTKGVPIRIKGEAYGYSLDAFLMMMWNPLKPMPAPPTEQDAQRCRNPYFGKREAFSFKKYGFYLAARLDGYTEAQANALIDHSLKAKPGGKILLDMDPGRADAGFAKLNDSMPHAAKILEARKIPVELDETEQFIGDRVGLGGYYSWGSNDKHYNVDYYRSLRFTPGAIAETCVSTSAHTFRKSVWTQSLIGDLIEQGITGVKGYVSEPYTIALCPADILFDRYTAGFNLADSFYMASPYLMWKDVVIGDPLCAPYAKKVVK